MANFVANTNTTDKYECTVTGDCKDSGTSNFRDKAGAWHVACGIATTNGVLNDSFYYIVGFEHQQAPHGEAMVGALITPLITIDADSSTTGANTLPPTAIGIAHENHFDVLEISGTYTVATTMTFDSISAFSIDIVISHVETLPRGVKLMEASSNTESFGF